MILTASKLSKTTFPFSVLFVVVSCFFWWFYYSGLQTIFPLYLVDILGFSQKDATMYFHVFCMCGSFFPLFAGLLGDSKLGKYRTVLYLFIASFVGSAAFIAASTPVIDTGSRRFLTGLAVLAICLGGGYSCITTPFGGDQFASSLPSKKLSLYFSISYYITTLSCLASIFVTPILRHNYQCFGKDTCFPLAFSVLGVMLVLSLVVFVAGRSVYDCKTPEKNIIKDVIECTSYALSRSYCSENKKKHWLDYAEDKFSKTLISDTKAAFEVLWLLLPVPVFWALDDQTGSTWEFQAMHMDGSLGWFTIKPDQMQLLDPLMTLILVPLFDLLIYPLLSKSHLLETPIERLTVGGLLASSSFVLAALLELKIQSTLTQLPGDGIAQLRVFNGLNCDIQFNDPLAPSSGVIPSLGALQILEVPQKDTASYPVSFSMADDCYLRANYNFSGTVTLQERQASSLFLHAHEQVPVVSQVPGFDRIDKTDMENSKLRVLYNLAPFVSEITLTQGRFSKTYTLDRTAFSTSLDTILHTGNKPVYSAPMFFLWRIIKIVYIAYLWIYLYETWYSAKLGNSSISADIELGPAGIYTLIVYSYNSTTIGRLITVTSPNRVHMLWQLPQYIIITVAEVMFSITGNELSYTQAPETMKSLISVAWTMTDAFGNLLVSVIIFGQFFDNQVYEYLFYSVLMALASFIFKYMSARYQYYAPESY